MLLCKSSFFFSHNTLNMLINLNLVISWIVNLFCFLAEGENSTQRVNVFAENLCSEKHIFSPLWQRRIDCRCSRVLSFLSSVTLLFIILIVLRRRRDVDRELSAARTPLLHKERPQGRYYGIPCDAEPVYAGWWSREHPFSKTVKLIVVERQRFDSPPAFFKCEKSL